MPISSDWLIYIASVISVCILNLDGRNPQMNRIFHFRHQTFKVFVDAAFKIVDAAGLC